MRLLLLSARCPRPPARSGGGWRWRNERSNTWRLTDDFHNGSRQVYALVAREKTVLAEYTATSGNFPTVTRVLLAKIPPSDGRMSYVYDK